MSSLPFDPAGTQAAIARVSGAGRLARTPFAGGRITWRIWGTGPALVLLHGGHGSWLHWIRNVQVLAQSHCVMVPDMPGYGDSDDLVHPHKLEAMAEAVSCGLTALIGDKPFVLAAFSFGATVAGMVTIRLGNQIRALVLVGPAGLGLTRPPMGNMQNWRALEGEAMLRANRNNLGVLMLHDPASIDELAVYQQIYNTDRTRFRSRDISHTDVLRRCIDTVRPPILSIWGSEDATARGNIDTKVLDLLRQADPLSAQIVIEGAGHWVQFEQPVLFNAALQSLLSRLDARTGSVPKILCG